MYVEVIEYIDRLSDMGGCWLGDSPLQSALWLAVGFYCTVSPRLKIRKYRECVGPINQGRWTFSGKPVLNSERGRLVSYSSMYIYLLVGAIPCIGRVNF